VPQESVPRKVKQSSESVGGIDVPFNDVECEVVRTAKRPDRNAKQQRAAQVRLLHQQERRSECSERSEKAPFKPDDAWVRQVCHAVIPKKRSVGSPSF